MQKSGLTEDRAVSIGKLLNVPAVMVVRITEFTVDSQKDIETGRNVTVARIALGARLVGVESGLILWTGTQVTLSDVSGKGEAHDSLAEVAENVAKTFPARDSTKLPAVETGKAIVKKISSDGSFDPKALTRLAVVVADDPRHQNGQANLQAIVEDEFVQTLIRKGYSLVSRSDIQAIIKEKQFQKSGLTEDNAAAVGKLLNVPAVLVVRITDSAVEQLVNPTTRTMFTVASASVGARLISVETGLILWTGTFTHSIDGGHGELSGVVANVAKTMAGGFPDKNLPKVPAVTKEATKPVRKPATKPARPSGLR